MALCPVVSFVMRSRHSTRRAALACIAWVLAAATAGAAGEGEWLDIEGQIQYGYYTEDARALANLATRLDSKEDTDPLKAYYAALAYYRLSFTVEEADPARAAEGLEHCVASLAGVLQQRADWAEALALDGACLGSLAQLKPLRAPFAGPKSRSQLTRALQLEPRNPRVLMLDGWREYEHAQGSGRAVKDGACAKLQRAVAAFEAARRGEEHVPEWGTAEGYALWGRCELDRGEPVAARDALERALLIAPEFALARRLIARITAG
jgi:hypothetical protein